MVEGGGREAGLGQEGAWEAQQELIVSYRRGGDGLCLLGGTVQLCKLRDSAVLTH